jgi:thioesterase domain-containing protein
VKIRGFRIELAEIENALSEHPDVGVAAVKVINVGPLDKRLAAYIVPVKGRVPDEGALREFLKQKLPAYMIPSTYLASKTLPLTPNGKLDRKALPAPQLNHVPVRCRESLGSIEVLLLQIWEDLLQRRPIGLDDDFFDLGGHSLLGVRLLASIERAFRRRLSLANFFEAPTVRKMAGLLRRSGSKTAHSRLIPISSSGDGAPLFLIGPQPLFRPLILRLAKRNPVIGFLQPDPTDLKPPFRTRDLAGSYVGMLREYQPHGPYSLAGWCADGVLAFEMAQQLRVAGEEVPVVILIDSFNPARWKYESHWAARWDRSKFHARNMAHLDFRHQYAYLKDRLETARRHTKRVFWPFFCKLHIWTERRLNDQSRLFDQILSVANREYLPLPYDGRVVLIRAAVRPPGTHADAAFGWRHIIPNLSVVDVSANHREIFIEPNVEVMASALSAALLTPESKYGQHGPKSV